MSELYKHGDRKWEWFWVSLALYSVSIVAVVFAAWELVENGFFREMDYLTLHYLYITRGIASSLLLGFWAAWYVLHQRRHSDEKLRRSRERYRGLLEASPGAVALYDARFRVTEWNATAERVYGFNKAEMLGQVLSTVPPEKETELRGFLRQVEAGESVLDVETLRRDKQGATLDVQLSLLPFHEAGQDYFLEVTSDIRERVRLRQKLLEIEKLTSMGKMAAGTAHHLNTPMAAMLLRVQMMRERTGQNTYPADLERLEASIRFCKQFVSRLLEFSRPGPIRKQPERVTRSIQSVLSFLAPAWLAKRVRASLHPGPANEAQVLADCNLLEALFLTLFSNALDAVAPEGSIDIRCRQPSAEWIEIEVGDNGCGIAETALPHIFEPFFSTKAPGKGTGLGLAIARNIVREHGGSIRVNSKLGQGTTVFVQLPRHGSAPAAEGPSS